MTKPISLPEMSSDHNPVKFSIRMTDFNKDPERIRSFKFTDWTLFKKTLDRSIKINNNLNSPDKLEAEVGKFTRILSYAMNRHSRLIKPTYRDRLPDEILNLIRNRNRLRREYQHAPRPETMLRLKNLNKSIKNKIKYFKNKQWEQRLKDVSVKDGTLWQLTKAIKKCKKPMPALTDSAGNKAILNRARAQLLVEHYRQVHRLPESNYDQRQIESFVNDFLDQTPLQTLTHATFTSPAEIQSILKSLRRNKAPGVDGICHSVLKHLSLKAVVQLTNIANAVLRLQSQWKIAKVIPIVKPGKDSSLPVSYRPISLLSCVGKVVERVIQARLNDELQRCCVLPHAQFGFRRGHSAVHQIARLTRDVYDAFNDAKSTVFVGFDMEKAFDKVWFEGLLYKLIIRGVSPLIIRLLNSYLVGRTFFVQVGGDRSTTCGIEAGVPQGSILGPSLYSTYLSDVPTCKDTQMALFADDTAIYASDENADEAAARLQSHITQLEQFWSHWKLQVNPTKTESIVFTWRYKQTRLTHPLTVNNHDVRNTNDTRSIRYLGVVLDRRLFYHLHVTHVIKKAYAAMRLCFSLMAKNSALSKQNKRTLYIALVRPVLTYAAPIWCGALSKTQHHRLQVYQNKALRLVTGGNRYSRITELHEQSSTPMFREHAMQLSYAFFKKLEEQQTDNPLIKRILHNITDYQHVTHKHPIFAVYAFHNATLNS